MSKPYALELELYRNWYNASHYFLDNVIKNVESHGLKVDQFRVLEFLYSHEGPHTIQKISEQLHIPSGSITYVINNLAKKDYVQKKPCPTDGRVTHVSLTATGEEMIREIVPEHIEFISSKIGKISEEEMKLLLELLGKLKQCFRKDS